MATTDEGIRALNQDEHNEDAHAKRVVIRGQNPVDGNFYNIASVDKGDGSFGLSIGGSITAASSTLADFSTNDILDAATSYFGKTKPDGTWLVQKLTSTSVSYATVTNNGAVTTYTDAWTNKSTLTYGRFDEAF